MTTRQLRRLLAQHADELHGAVNALDRGEDLKEVYGRLLLSLGRTKSVIAQEDAQEILAQL